MTAITEVDAVIKALERQRAAFTKLLKEVRDTKAGHTWDTLGLLRVLQSADQRLTVDPALSTTIASARSVVDQKASTALLELEADVRDLCGERGWRIDGIWPNVYVERAIEVRVDEPGRVISIGGSRLKKLTMASIAKALGSAVAELIPRGFVGKDFIEELARAYDQATAGRSGEARVGDVYRELVLMSQSPKFWRDARANYFSQITADQFRARITAALEAGVRSDPAGRELRLLPPLDPKDAVFLYQPDERRFGFVGRIEFRVMEGGSDGSRGL